jgi:hypothetical protein
MPEIPPPREYKIIRLNRIYPFVTSIHWCCDLILLDVFLAREYWYIIFMRKQCFMWMGPIHDLVG